MLTIVPECHARCHVVSAQRRPQNVRQAVRYLLVVGSSNAAVGNGHIGNVAFLCHDNDFSTSLSQNAEERVRMLVRECDVWQMRHQGNEYAADKNQ